MPDKNIYKNGTSGAVVDCVSERRIETSKYQMLHGRMNPAESYAVQDFGNHDQKIGGRPVRYIISPSRYGTSHATGRDSFHVRLLILIDNELVYTSRWDNYDAAVNAEAETRIIEDVADGKRYVSEFTVHSLASYMAQHADTRDLTVPMFGSTDLEVARI